jgi:Transglycosylase SLT domain
MPADRTRVEARRARMAPILDAAATAAGIDPALLRAVAFVESEFNPLAVGPVTRATGERARGMLQLMPATAKELGVSDPHDPKQSAAGGAKYLARMITKYGDVRRALHAYNWGPGNVDTAERVPKQVTGYADKVLARADFERQHPPGDAPPGEAPPRPIVAAAAPSSPPSCSLCGGRLVCENCRAAASGGGKAS